MRGNGERDVYFGLGSKYSVTDLNTIFWSRRRMADECVGQQELMGKA